MDIINFLLSGVAILNLILVYFLFSSRRDSKNISYLAVVFGVIFWTVSIIFYRIVDEGSLLLWTKVLYVAATFTASPFLYFSTIFPYGKDRFWKFAAIAFPHLIVIYLIVFTSTVIDSVELIPGGENKINFGSLYYVYALYISGYFSLGFVNLGRKYFASHGSQRLQVRYVFVGYFLAANLAMITNLILPWFGIFSLNWLGQILSLFMTTFTVYAIVRYRLMDIRIIMRRSVVYLLSLMTVLLVAFGLIYFNNSYFYNLFGSAAMGAVVLVFSVVIFAPIQSLYLKIANKYFFTSLYNYQRTLSRLTQELTTIIDLERIVDLVVEIINRTMGVEQVMVLLFEKPENAKRKKAIVVKNLEFNEKGILSLISNPFFRSYVNKVKGVFTADEILDFGRRSHLNKTQTAYFGSLNKKLGNAKITVFIPLFIKKKAIGYIVLGRKLTKDAYTREDLALLSTMANQASVAIQNANLYEEVQDYSKNLQDKVQQQTKEIRELYEMKSNFLTVASHQLRTPTSIIRGMLSMLVEDEKLPQKKQDEMIDAAFKSSSALERVINDILTAAEIDASKFAFQPQEVDILPVVDVVVDELKLKAEKKGLELKYKKPRFKTAKVLTDESKIEQVFANLIDNALNYTTNGSVEVSVFKKQIRGKKYIGFSCKDTGVGMTKKDIQQIGEKFFRSSNVFSVHPNGTGLGVYIVKQVVEESGGKMTIESEGLGKGSVFSVFLRIA